MSRPKKGRTRYVGRSLESVLAEVHPSQLAGIEVGGEPVTGSPLPDRPVQTTSQAIAHMQTGEGVVLEPDSTEMWTFGDDRLLGGVDVTISPEWMRQMQAGYRCLRCWEPQDESFPLHCSLCQYEMKELQIRDIAIEVQGTKHLGPSKPVDDYVAELNLEAEKKKFARKIHEGGSVRRRRAS